MIKTYPKIIVANWKSGPDNLFEAKKNLTEIKKIKINNKKIIPIICIPNIYLDTLTRNYRGSNLKFGVQNISHTESGELTAETTAKMLKDLKINYAIVGHSERRRLGENDNLISQKIMNALKNKITPIVCIGEKERDVGGEYLREIRNQLYESLNGLTKEMIKKIIIAYEPVWAVGSGGHVISIHELNQIILYIKKVLVEKFDRKTGLGVNILYGGSINQDNFDELLSADVNGFLIGRASVNPYVFKDLIKKIN
jgi:triosephosphate isomerase (TIM)